MTAPNIPPGFYDVEVSPGEIIRGAKVLACGSIYVTAEIPVECGGTITAWIAIPGANFYPIDIVGEARERRGS